MILSPRTVTTTITVAFPKRKLVDDHRAGRKFHISKVWVLRHDVHEIRQLDPEDGLQREEFGSVLVVQSDGGGVINVPTRGPQRLSEVIAELTPEGSTLV